MCREARLEQGQGGFEDLADLDRGEHDAGLAGEAPEMGDQLGGAGRQGLDPGEGLAGIFRTVALEQQRAVMGMGADRGERLVELVAEPRGHLAEGGELGGLDQVVARLAEHGERAGEIAELVIAGLGQNGGGLAAGDAGRGLGEDPQPRHEMAPDIEPADQQRPEQ